MEDYEKSKYLMFFHYPKRKAINGEKINILSVVEKVFNSIFKGNYTYKLFLYPKNYR